MVEENKIILYQDDNEITRVSVRFAEEDLWLTQNQLAEIYDTTKQNISQHIDNILNDGELNVSRTVKEFLTVRQEGNRQVKRNIAHYNLDMIIALGYRIQSQVATRFRRWATQRLHEYIQKGFAMDDERLKQGGNRYFRELLQALEMNPMTMKDWIEALDNQIIAHKRKVLLGKGTVSHKQAIEKAEKEFEIYRKREIELMESDFDKLLKNYRIT